MQLCQALNVELNINNSVHPMNNLCFICTAWCKHWVNDANSRTSSNP